MRNARMNRPKMAGRGPVTALCALVGILWAAGATACPPGHGRHFGKGASQDCDGQRLGPVSWSVRSSHPAVHMGGSARVLVEIKLHADRLPAGTRRPIAVAIVLDRSGSMQGRKWDDAAEAARSAIRRLRNGDIVSIVSYASDVRVDWPAQRFASEQRDDLLRVIGRMSPSGSTFLEGGLRKGAEQLAKFVDGVRPARVLLVSDGNANVGVQSGHGLAQVARRNAAGGIVTTTIGLGTDYNEDTMTAVADGGSGSYYYVRDSERLGDTFSKELERMMTTAARRIAVRIVPGPGVRVVDVLGYDGEAFGDGGMEIPLGELASDADRSLLVELEVHCSSRGRQRLAEVELELLDGEGERRRGRADVAVDATDDNDRVERERDLGVIGRHEEHKLAHEMRASAEMVSQGKGTEAKERLNRAAARAKQFAGRSGNKALSKSADEAQQQAQQAPAAAADAPAEREHTKKSMKARAYQMAK